MPSLPKDRDAHLPVGPAQACGSTPSLMKTETSSRAPCLRQAHGACRIAVMLWNPMAKKPIHLGYWPSSLAAARMADK